MKNRFLKDIFSEKLYCRVFSAIALLFFTTAGFAQVNDAGLWVGVNVEKKITKKLTAALSEELRFNENVSELGTAFTEAGVEYKLVKNLTVGVAYRFIQKRQLDDFYSLRHRGIASLTYKLKAKRIEISIREKYQAQYTDVNSSDDGKVPDVYLRNKLTIKYDSQKKYTPFVASELFYQLNNPDGNEFDNVRYTAGFEYKFNKLNSADLFYLLNREFNVNNPLTEYIIGISYTYIF
jgi:hypothetical protein